MNVPRADCLTRPISAKLVHETHVPAVLRVKPARIHPDLAGVSVARLGEHPGGRSQRRRQSETGRPSSERILQAAVGRGGGCNTGRHAACCQDGIGTIAYAVNLHHVVLLFLLLDWMQTFVIDIRQNDDMRDQQNNLRKLLVITLLLVAFIYPQ